ILRSVFARSSCRLFADPGASAWRTNMEKNLPARPNLDHLRRQAKTLLAELESGASAAVATFVEYLPAAKEMTSEQVRAAGFRLADAQSAVARKSGFASWPHWAPQVEQLRRLRGHWAFG